MVSVGRNRQRGSGLASTLMVCGVLVALAFAVASSSIAHLTMNSRFENGRVAGDLAESAAASCLAKVLKDTRWQGDVEVSLASAPGGWGRVTFTSQKAGQWDVPVSVNNLENSAAVTINGQQIGPASLRVRAVGRYRGVTRSLTQVIAIPPFRYALSSTGAIVSNGGLTVASLDDPGLLAGGFDRLLDEQLKAGNLAGNRSGAESVVLNSSPSRPVLVKGCVDSAGSVVVAREARVLGGVNENGAPVPVPRIAVDDYDPRERTDVVELDQLQQGHLKLEKPTRRQGDLKVASGLELDGGYLYIDGNLDIYGGLTGKGAIFATGDVKIHGLATFGTHNQEAIVARGNVGIEGTGRDHSIFQGVVYTEGDLNAKDVTLVGSMVGNKPNPTGQEGSRIQLDTCHVLYNRQLMESVWNSGFNFQMEAGDESVGAGEDPLGSLLMFDVGRGLEDVRPIIQVFNPKARDFYDPEKDEFQSELQSGKDMKAVVRVPTVNGDYQEFPSLAKAVSVLSQPNHGYPIRVRVNTLLGETSDRLWRLLRRYGLPFPEPPPPEFKDTWDPTVVAAMQATQRVNRTFLFGSAMRTWINIQVESYNDYYKRTRKAWMKHGEFGFSLNPNQFLSMSDKIRMLMWSDE